MLCRGMKKESWTESHIPSILFLVSVSNVLDLGGSTMLQIVSITMLTKIMVLRGQMVCRTDIFCAHRNWATSLIRHNFPKSAMYTKLIPMT
mmetsp:Transcript_17556/g.36069  ORF Transcript_17556/g.36069 Transcript_17556/m.36069 type:complete len:91 (+) Transcript_17556:2001-2273(+)